MRSFKVSALVVAIGLLPLLVVGVLIKQREHDRAAVDSSLVSLANVQAKELEAGFAAGRTIALLLSSNPSFTDFYATRGTRAEKIAAQGRPIARITAALTYLERLYPGAIGEACFIDRGGRENARVVRGVGALPGDLSDESQNPFFGPSIAQPVGGVHQSAPYVSPDTGEWVISNATPISGPTGAVAAIVHFELTVESFRRAAVEFAGGDEVAVVDARTGAVVLNSRRPQRAGGLLGDPSDRRFAGLAGARGLVDKGGSRVAYRTVSGGGSNRWIVVAVAPSARGLSIVPIAAVLLALLGLALVMGRRWAKASEQAETDPLTGLGNRRKLDADFPRLLTDARETDGLLLSVYDLNGFKNYNDSFGHPAGDALLARFGTRLAATTPAGRAYRLGGDEFCTVIADGEQAPRIIEATLASLGERGEGWEISSALGTIRLPTDAIDADTALRLADQRLYAAKQSGRRSPGRQSTDVLLQALRERNPDLGSHLHDVGGLAVAVGERLGLPAEEIDVLRLAGELHDVGKVAIPDAVLSKLGPLDPDEWRLMLQHTLIGERILSAAPALSQVAKLVRSSHERHDGAGYPEGLAAEQIPLGARIIAVCDAYDAMIGPRPYRLGMSEEVALDELRRCAGEQFDPAIVAAFCDVCAQQRSEVQRSLTR